MGGQWLLHQLLVEIVTVGLWYRHCPLVHACTGCVLPLPAPGSLQTLSQLHCDAGAATRRPAGFSCLGSFSEA